MRRNDPHIERTFLDCRLQNKHTLRVSIMNLYFSILWNLDIIERLQHKQHVPTC